MYGLISTTHVAVSTILLQSNDFCYEVTFDDTFSITPTPTFYVADTEITYEDGYYASLPPLYLSYYKLGKDATERKSPRKSKDCT